MAWGSTQGRTYRHWSTGAIECYERNCVCKGCPTFDLIGKQCRMKQSVLSLVKNVGTPDTDPKQSIIDDENIKCRSGVKTKEGKRKWISRYFGY